MMCEKRQVSVWGRTFGIYIRKMGYQRHIEIFANVTSRRSTGTNILFYSYPFLFRNINFALHKWKQAQFSNLILGTIWKCNWFGFQIGQMEACAAYETWGNDSGSQGRPAVTYPLCWVQDWRWTGPHPRSWQRTAAPSPCWCIVSPRWRDPWRTRKEWMNEWKAQTVESIQCDSVRETKCSKLQTLMTTCWHPGCHDC